MYTTFARFGRKPASQLALDDTKHFFLFPNLPSNLYRFERV